jgi:hypothetical protein
MVKYLQFYEQFYKELSSLKLTSHVLLYLTTVNSVTGGDTSWCWFCTVWMWAVLLIFQRYMLTHACSIMPCLIWPDGGIQQDTCIFFPLWYLLSG